MSTHAQRNQMVLRGKQKQKSPKVSPALFRGLHTTPPVLFLLPGSPELSIHRWHPRSHGSGTQDPPPPSFPVFTKPEEPPDDPGLRLCGCARLLQCGPVPGGQPAREAGRMLSEGVPGRVGSREPGMRLKRAAVTGTLQDSLELRQLGRP